MIIVNSIDVDLKKIINCDLVKDVYYVIRTQKILAILAPDWQLPVVAILAIVH